MEPVRGKSDMETAYTNTISEYESASGVEKHTESYRIASFHISDMEWKHSVRLPNLQKPDIPVKHLPGCASDPGLRGSSVMPKILQPD